MCNLQLTGHIVILFSVCVCLSGITKHFENAVSGSRCSVLCNSCHRTLEILMLCSLKKNKKKLTTVLPQGDLSHGNFDFFLLGKPAVTEACMLGVSVFP